MAHATKVLMVDDDPDVRLMIRMAIDNGQRLLCEASTARDGLQAANDLRPDILLLDIGLPGQFNGFSLCEALVKDPIHHGVRIVVISGHGDPEDIEQARRLGVAHYLVKPFSPSYLAKLIVELESRIDDMQIVRGIEAGESADFLSP